MEPPLKQAFDVLGDKERMQLTALMDRWPFARLYWPALRDYVSHGKMRLVVDMSFIEKPYAASSREVEQFERACEALGGSAIGHAKFLEAQVVGGYLREPCGGLTRVQAKSIMLELDRRLGKIGNDGVDTDEG